MTETLYLLDAHSLIYQVFHAIPAMTGPKGQPTNAVYGFTGDMLRLLKKKPAYIIGVFDPPGKTFRDDLYAEYKFHRAPMPSDLQVQIPVIFRLLEALRIPIVQVDGFEADDAIATIAHQAAGCGIEVFICTGDKDCRQLIGEKVKIYNLRKDVVLDCQGLLTDWKITPKQVVDLLALVGDSVDNVPGVPGIGMKTAQKLLQDFGNIEGIIANVEQLAGRARESLKKSAEALTLSRKLIELSREVPVGCDWKKWRLQPSNTPKLLALFQECGFHRYANEVQQEKAKTAPVAKPEATLFDGVDGNEKESGAAAMPDQWKAEYHLIDTEAKFETFLGDLQKQDRIAIDVKTTSLSPYEAEIVGIAICWQAGEAYYLPLRGPAGQAVLDPQKTLNRLRPVLESPNVQKVNQNIKYDLLVLRRAGIRLAGLAGDSMIAGYLLASGERNHDLGELSLRHLEHSPSSIDSLIGKGTSQTGMEQVDVTKVARYAAEDADIAWRLCDQLEPHLKEAELWELYQDLEVPLVEVLADLEYTGISLDVPLLRRLGGEFAERLAAVEQEIYRSAGRAFNIGSPKQLRQVLFDELKLPTQRKTSITGEASTGQEVLEDLAAAGHELPRYIIEHRQIAKLKGTYVDALPELVSPATGRIHASFNQTVAATGRLSSSDPNLQNIPVRSAYGKQIRQAFVPGEKDWVLLTADYSQIELRILAHFSEDAELQKAFHQDRDIHAYVAAQIYGIPEEEVNDEQRRNAKTVNFGVIYGLSAFGLAKRLGISNQEAGTFIDAYFARYPGVEAFQTELLAKARRHGFVTTILGRRRYFEPSAIREKSSYRQRNQAEREALNAVIQGSAADLIKKAMLQIHRRLRHEERRARMLLQIHDELVFESPRHEVDTVAGLVVDEMTTALELNVPLKVDVAAGPNWLDTEPLEASRERVPLSLAAAQ